MLNVLRPAINAGAVAFVFRNQPLMCEMNLCFIILLSNLKNNFSSYPFAFVFRKTKIVVQYKSNYFFIRNNFY